MHRLLALVLFASPFAALAALAPIPEEQTREVLFTCQNSGTSQNSCYLRDAIGNTEGLGEVRIIEATIDRLLSKKPCTGKNFTKDHEKIVTRGGCGAVFQVRYTYSVTTKGIRRHELSLRCESKGGEPRECRLDEVLPVSLSYTKILGATLQADLSGNGCEEKKWTWEPTRIKVEAGCRGLFQVQYESYGRRPLFVETQQPAG